MRPAADVAYIGPLLKSHHRVTYIDGASARVLARTVRRTLVAAGVYCLGVWPPPMQLPPLAAAYSNFKILKRTASIVFGQVDETTYISYLEEPPYRRERVVFRGRPDGPWRFLDTGDTAPDIVAKLYLEVACQDGLDRELAEARRLWLLPEEQKASS